MSTQFTKRIRAKRQLRSLGTVAIQGSLQISQWRQEKDTAILQSKQASSGRQADFLKLLKIHVALIQQAGRTVPSIRRNFT
jgi:hypothetical protein